MENRARAAVVRELIASNARAIEVVGLVIDGAPVEPLARLCGERAFAEFWKVCPMPAFMLTLGKFVGVPHEQLAAAVRHVVDAVVDMLAMPEQQRELLAFHAKALAIYRKHGVPVHILGDDPMLLALAHGAVLQVCDGDAEWKRSSAAMTAQFVKTLLEPSKLAINEPDDKAMTVTLGRAIGMLVSDALPVELLGVAPGSWGARGQA